MIFILNQLSHKVRQISLNSLKAFFQEEVLDSIDLIWTGTAKFLVNWVRLQLNRFQDINDAIDKAWVVFLNDIWGVRDTQISNSVLLNITQTFWTLWKLEVVFASISIMNNNLISIA